MSKVSISVIMPVYNGANYIAECLESILAQTFTDYEVLIADDGSTDNTCDIISSYNDKRIKLFKRGHNYIDSCNFLLEKAHGKYIARIDADDLMLPNRLQIQYDYMELHPDIDILGGGMIYFGDTNSIYKPFIGDVTIHELMDGCCIAHPTSFLRKSSITSHKLHYRQEYIYAEDFDFWVEAASKGLRLRNIDDILTKYRISNNQITNLKRKEQCLASEAIRNRIASEIIKETGNALPAFSNQISKQKLSVIIACYNDGKELIKTIEGIKSTIGVDVVIIVVDDCSTDSYDFSHILEEYNVVYTRNEVRIGAAASKEKGVRLCTTDYFIIFDSHMRFYGNNWGSTIIQELDSDEKQILCCQTKVLINKNGEIVEEKDRYAYGAYLYMGTDTFIPRARWNTSPKEDTITSGFIPCVLGACYATSVRFWKKIKGLEGLLGFGSEEPYLSMKAWLLGGKCRLLNDIVIGHIYKDCTTNFNMYSEYIYNLLMISKTLFPTDLQCKVAVVAKNIDKDKFLKAKILINKNIKKINVLHRYYGKSVNTMSLNKYIKQNYILSKENKDKLETGTKLLKQILFKAETAIHNLFNYGIQNGFMGIAVLYSLYSKYYDEPVYKKKAQEIIYNICTKIEKEEFPVFFDNGLMGIGWALIYLTENGILSIYDTKDVLINIDHQVSILNPNRIEELLKLHDMVLYCQTRLGFCKRSKTEHQLDSTMIKLLKKKCEKICTSSNFNNINLKQQTTLTIMSLYNCSSWSTMPADIHNTMDLPTYLPKDEKFWQFGLDGYIGYGINILATKLKIS